VAGEQDRGWTIGTLKELIDTKLNSFDIKLEARDKALDLQAAENKRRLDELNHEHARVAQAQQTYVSKDTWDGFVEADQVWKGRVDLSLQAMVPRAEFQAYKDTTEKALTLKAGQSTGRHDVVAWIIAAVASTAAIAATIVALRGR